MKKRSYVFSLIRDMSSSFRLQAIKFTSGIVLVFFLTIAISIGLISCRHMPENISALPTICFQSQVLPIFQNSCAMSGCHNGTGESGFDLSTYQGIMEGVTPGNANKSRVYRAITNLWGESAMPPQQPLSETNRTIIRLWIEQGAVNNSCDTQGPDTNPPSIPSTIDSVCFQQVILPLVQSNCAVSGCHDGSSRSDDAPQLTTYNQILRIVSPTNPNYSKFYRVITGSGEERMPPPPQNKLTTAQIQSVNTWISEGAKNNSCSGGCDTAAAVTYSATVWPIIQTYCLGCHSGPNAQKGQYLENYTDISNVASTGMLLGVIKGSPGYNQMPPTGPIPSCQIAQIEKWVNEGFSNTRLP